MKVWVDLFYWLENHIYRHVSSLACCQLAYFNPGDMNRRRSEFCLLPWARRTRVGRRNLLTTASNGSANGLQVISDRLADNFSILPGHHATGDNGDSDGEDSDGGGDDDELEEGDGGGGIMAKSFAMFEWRRGSAVTVGAHERWEGARALSLSSSLSFSVCRAPPPPHINHNRVAKSFKFWFCRVYNYNGDHMSSMSQSLPFYLPAYCLITCPVLHVFHINYCTALSTEVNLSWCVGGKW